MRKRTASSDFRLRVADYCLAAVLVLGVSGAAAAQNKAQDPPGVNRDQPVHIKAETLEIQDKIKTATFSGNVQVVQGDTTMTCRTLVVFYGPEEATKAVAPTPTESRGAPAMPNGGTFRRAEARGDVTVVSKDQNATGDLGVYDVKTKTITLTGNVVVSQARTSCGASELWSILRPEMLGWNLLVTGSNRASPLMTASG